MPTMTCLLPNPEKFLQLEKFRQMRESSDLRLRIELHSIYATNSNMTSIMFFFLAVVFNSNNTLVFLEQLFIIIILFYFCYAACTREKNKFDRTSQFDEYKPLNKIILVGLLILVVRIVFAIYYG